MIYKKIRNFFILIIAIGYILFEEIFWIRLAKPIYSYILKYHLYQNFLNYVEYSMNRYLILFIFGILFIVSEILGPVAFGYLIAGNIIFGLSLYVLKMIPLIIAFAIFERGKEKLFSFLWFKKVYMFITGLIDKLKGSSVYIGIKDNVILFKEKIYVLIKRKKKNLHMELFKETVESIKDKK